MSCPSFQPPSATNLQPSGRWPYSVDSRTAEQSKSTERVELVPPKETPRAMGKPSKQGKNHLAQVMELLLESQLMDVFNVLCPLRFHQHFEEI